MRNILLFIFTIILACSGANQSFAEVKTKHHAPPLLITAEQQLAVEKTHHAVLANKLRSLQKDQKDKEQVVLINANALHRADLAIAMAQADLDGIVLTLNAAQQTVALTENNIDSLENLSQNATTISNTSNQQQAQLQTQINDQQVLLALQQERVKVLQKTQNLAEQALADAQDAKVQLQTKYQLQQQQQRQQSLDRLAVSLQSEQQKWLTRLAQLNQQLQQRSVSEECSADNAKFVMLELGIFEAEERSNLSQIQLDLARLHNRLQDLTATSTEQNVSLSTLNNSQKQIDTLLGQLKDTNSMLKSKIDLLQKRIKIITQGQKSGTVEDEEADANLDLLSTLQASYQKQLTDATDLETQARTYQSELAQQLNKQLANRQGLPGFSMQPWIQLTEKICQIPMLTWQTLNGLQKPFVSAILTASGLDWLLWVTALVAWSLLAIKLRHYIKAALNHARTRSQDIFANNVLIVCLKLLYRHLPALMLLSGFMGLLLMMGLSLQLFSLIIYLSLVWIVFSILINLARLALLESTTHKEGSDVRLYQRLKWVLRIGGLLTALTVLVHQLPIAYDIQDLFGRFFMLFLLVVALVLLWGWEVVPTLLAPYLERKKPYIRQIVRWLSFLVPLSILINSLIGLIGYVELAWSIAADQGLFLIVLTGYLLARGLLAEVMKFLSEKVIRWSRNGWLWSEALLKPFHQVLKFFLLLETIGVLFNLFGWGSHSLVVTKLGDFLRYHLFTVADSVITPWSIIVLLIIIAVIVWAARWAREFAYRWLFASTKDLGLRNSLAIFTQYTIVAIGTLLALKVAGINVTALTLIASAFAFGIGLGLRDIANNFVSGLLLLIERPVQVGDYITVGALEGEVMHIGMRSITVTTDDHKELLVPNADAFSKSFVNWTHRDSIIRKTFMIRVSREDDPQRVKEIILEVLRSIPKIVTNPPPQVFFERMENVLLEFEIEYFIDMKLTPSRQGLNSQIQFALWNRFKAEGIHPPEYPHEIVLHNPS